MTYESSYNKNAEHRLPVFFDAHFRSEAIRFIEFLRSVGKKHNLELHYRSYGRDCLQILINKKQEGHFDTLLQELILSRGLHYYVCSLPKKNKTKVVEGVVLPIYKALLDGRFYNSYAKYLNHHILARISPNDFVPGDMDNEFSREFEILYRKWNLALIDDEGFILELDSLMMRFLLTQIGHKDGEKSPEFNVVLAKANQVGIGMARDFKKVFQKVHSLRTAGLHRLGKPIPKEELSDLAVKAFIYFQYFDEFSQAQDNQQEKLHGVLFDRVKYGDERWFDSEGEPYKDESGAPYDYAKIASLRPCGDCGAVKGQYHCDGCDMEICPRCGHQFLSCDCKTESDYED